MELDRNQKGWLGLIGLLLSLILGYWSIQWIMMAELIPQAWVSLLASIVLAARSYNTALQRLSDAMRESGKIIKSISEWMAKGE